MEANKRTLGEILSPEIRFEAPLFQRPYVWTKEQNWVPLWDALVESFDRFLTGAGSGPRPYFLGSLVLDLRHTATGSIFTREIIDGQQRLTTLQILFKAASDVFSNRGFEHEARQLHRLCFNDLEEETEQRFKVWPTNVDRVDYVSVMSSGSGDGMLAEGYRYFLEQLDGWLTGDPVTQKQRAAAIVSVARQGLVFIAIDLSSEDDGQLIFETLNALGTPLLPSDLVKNLLFREALRIGQSPDGLYERHWKPFEHDAQYWRTEVGVGRNLRPRIEVFVQHYLTLVAAKEVAPRHLFREYRELFLNGVLGDVAEALASLAQYGRSSRCFDEGRGAAPLRMLRQVLDLLETSALHPVCLGVLDIPEPSERDSIFDILQSYLVRRMLCGLTIKSLNRLAVELIQRLNADGWSAKTTQSVLMAHESNTFKWPSDGDVRLALTERSTYYWIKSNRVAYLLARAEASTRSSKTEEDETTASLYRNVTVEHLMPQKWETHWPLGPDASEDAQARRKQLLNYIGNLTIVTQALNSDVSNGPWDVKRAKLNDHTVLLTNSRLSKLNMWDEAAILKRSADLAETFCTIWPRG